MMGLKTFWLLRGSARRIYEKQWQKKVAVKMGLENLDVFIGDLIMI